MFYKIGHNEWTAEVAPIKKAKSDQVPLLAYLTTAYSLLGQKR